MNANRATGAPATDAEKRTFLGLRASRQRATTRTLTKNSYRHPLAILCNHMHKLVLKFFGMSVIVVCVASCSAGASEATDATQPTTATGTAPGGQGFSSAKPANAAPNAADKVSCPGLDDWDASSAQFEDEILLLVNAVRAKGVSCGGVDYPAVPPVKTNAVLRCVARQYAKNMSDNNFYEHIGLDGSSPKTRIQAAGLDWKGSAENIAFGQTTPADVMQAWLDSPAHCTSLMGEYTTLGVGLYKYYWAQDFMR